MNKLLVTGKDMQRYEILKDLVDKKITGTEASMLLGVSYVHTSRLKHRFIEGGLEGILRKIPSIFPNKKIKDEEIEEIIELRKEIYHDFNINHFRDKLYELHNIVYSYSSIKNILVKAGLHIPRKKKVVHRQRRRMPKAGMLVQMDSSQHNWLEHIQEKWWLIAMIDDATNDVPYAKFFPADTLFANMEVIRKFIEIRGIFMALYVDKASHFKTTRHGGIHYSINPEQDETQIERALSELDINLIPANSCQAKGRIEVTFRLFQDRLIKEMRLAGIRNYDEANKFLIEKFLPWYNGKYTHPAENVYRILPKDINLDLIFCIKKERKVNNDNTISFNNQIIQIPPSNIRLSFSRSKVDVCLLEDNRIFVLYKGKVIAEPVVSLDNKIIKKEKKIEELLNQREYLPIKTLPRKTQVPLINHPWRKSFVNWTRLKQIKKDIIKKEIQKGVEKYEELIKS